MGSETFLLEDNFNIQSFKVSAVFLEEKLKLSGMIFASNELEDAVNLKALPLHFLVVTPALIVIPSFYKA